MSLGTEDTRFNVQMVDAAESRRTARESEATQMLKSAEKLQRWMAEKR